MFLKQTSNLLSLSPCPLSPGKGVNTGTGVPATRLGATPKARMLWLLAKSFARCKTSRASNAKHPFLITIEVFRQTNAPVKTGAYIAYLSVSGVFFFLEGELTYQLLKRLCLCRKLFGCGGAFFGSSRVCLYNI